MRSSAPAPNHRPAQSTRSPAPAAEPAPGGWLAVLTEAVLGHRRIVAAFWLVVLVAGVVSVGTITKAFSD